MSAMGKMSKDCCMMKDGRMMMKGGKMMPMTENMTMADGTCKMMDGKMPPHGRHEKGQQNEVRQNGSHENVVSVISRKKTVPKPGRIFCGIGVVQ